MSKSIMQANTTYCYVCGRQFGLEKHHVMAGVANRKLSEKFGTWVMLCNSCHTGDNGAQYEKELNLKLKREAQTAFEKLYSHDDWMATFRKNYV